MKSEKIISESGGSRSGSLKRGGEATGGLTIGIVFGLIAASCSGGNTLGEIIFGDSMGMVWARLIVLILNFSFSVFYNCWCYILSGC